MNTDLQDPHEGSEEQRERVRAWVYSPGGSISSLIVPGCATLCCAIFAWLTNP